MGIEEKQDIVSLARDQLKLAAEVLARAFHDDPLWRYLVPDEARRRRVLPLALGIMADYSLRYGEVYTTRGLDGLACWLGPGHTTPTFVRLSWIGIRKAPLELGLAGLRRYIAAEDYTGALHKRIVPEPHWYLWALGVEPARQRRGIGAMLMRPVLARAEADGLPCYLETNNEVNVPFYQKYGFEVVSAGKVPGHELSIWAMLRKPGR